MAHEDFPSDLAIRVQGVGKTYRLGIINRSTFRDELIYRMQGLLRRGPGNSTAAAGGVFHALDDVSLDIRKGETVGLIGRNGAGKSTLLKILARITTPTRGDVWIRGRVGSMLEVGTGFHPELTGRENIYLNGSILGMPKSEIDAKFDEIVEFSEIGDFLDTPVKRYSSGMYVKLAFSIASSLETDVLLLDEVLAVGDAAFRRKSLSRMKTIAASGRTILFVSHSMANIREICSRCIWLERGRVREDGPTGVVSPAYEGDGVDGPATSLSASLRNLPRNRDFNGKIRLSAIEVCGASGAISPPASGAPATFRIVADVSSDVGQADFSLEIYDESGRPLMTFPSFLRKGKIPLCAGRRTVEISVPRLPLTAGQYRIGLYAASDGVDSDALSNALVFRVEDGDYFGSGKSLSNSLVGKIVFCEHEWRVS